MQQPTFRARLGTLLLTGAGLVQLAACAQGVAADGDSDATDADATDSDTSDSDTTDDGPGIDAGPFDPDAGPPPDATSALTGWQPVAPPLAAGADYAVPALTIDAAGKAIVAFLTDPSAGTGAAERSFEVQRAVAGEWQQVGERLSTANYLTIPQIAAAPGGELWLTWTTGNRSAVRHWDGATWATPAGTPLGDNSTFLPHTSVAIGPDGEPWVAYDEHVSPATNEQVYVRSGAAAAWTDRGSALGQNNALAPYLAARGDDICLTYQASGVYAMCWNGAAFAQVGGAIAPAGVSSPSTSSIALAPDGSPVVAFHAYKDNLDGTLGFVARWTGAAWQYLGQNLNATAGQVMGQTSHSSMQNVVVDDAGNAFVVWSEVDASGEPGTYVYRCAAGGGGCAPVGRGRLRVEGDPDGARIEIDAAGRPVVAWTEQSTSGRRVHVWRYHGDPDA